MPSKPDKPLYQSSCGTCGGTGEVELLRTTESCPRCCGGVPDADQLENGRWYSFDVSDGTEWVLPWVRLDVKPDRKLSEYTVRKFQHGDCLVLYRGGLAVADLTGPRVFGRLAEAADLEPTGQPGEPDPKIYMPADPPNFNIVDYGVLGSDNSGVSVKVQIDGCWDVAKRRVSRDGTRRALRLRMNESDVTCTSVRIVEPQWNPDELTLLEFYDL